MQEQLPRMLAEEPTGTYSWRVSEVVTYPVMRGLAQPFLQLKNITFQTSYSNAPRADVSKPIGSR